MATHIEEFAGRLRELKERSGCSYGMLATRLHVSTSTLHRYCNGVAVPAEYAPVERFARQCGASAAELVALHQRWLLADAAKRGEPADADAPAEVPADVHTDASAEVPADMPAEVPTDVPALVDDLPVPADPPGVPATAGTPAAGGRRPGRRARRATVVLAAVAVLAAVIPLALRSGGTRTPAGPSAPPASRASAPSASARPGTGGDPPLQVTVLADNWDTQCGQWFLIGQQPAKVPPPPSLQEGSAWAAALGGTPAGHLRLQLTAQGLPGQPVVLHALYVKVLSSAPAPKGNAYSPADGCGGGIDPAAFAVDLDTTAPRARAVTGSVDNGRRTARVDFPFRVSSADPQVLDVDGRTLDHDVSWYMDLVWSCGARQGTLRIDDHGVPFRTTGMKGDPTYVWSATHWLAGPPEPQ